MSKYASIFYLLMPLFSEKCNFPSFTDTSTLFPCFTVPSRIFSASASSISFCIVLLNGLAPYFSSYPLSTIYFFASSLSSMEIYICSIIRLLTFAIIMSTILPICSLLSAWNTMISSILLINSGLNNLLTSSITFVFIFS